MSFGGGIAELLGQSRGHVDTTGADLPHTHPAVTPTEVPEGHRVEQLRKCVES
ncbi:MAG: hypothetical protein ABJD68_07195 [Nakamurella sp.]